MNRKRLDKAIAVMERVVNNNYAFDMCEWQTPQEDIEIKLTEKKVHSCGTAACFAGWLAISPEFKKTGGKASEDEGCPLYKEKYGFGAIASWLNIPSGLAAELTGVNYSGDGLYFSDFYYKKIQDITAEDVLNKLYHLRDGDISLDDYL